MPHSRARWVLITGSIASWTFIGMVVATLASPTRVVLVSGLVLCGVAWTITILLAFPIRCKHCSGRIFIISKQRAAFDWHELKEQFMPLELLRANRIVCPHNVECRHHFPN